jgi:acyl carrier protein
VKRMSIEIEKCFNELISFIRKQIGEYNMPIERETLIEYDLGVTGEDAAELIQAFSIQYKVDISNFLFTNYFNEEPFVLLKCKSVKSFTVGHLEKGILAGRLDEEVINS